MGETIVPEDVCKALGARKNSIRLRAHTTEWKPHVFLRRVDLDLDSDEEGEANARHVAYYGLYAAKQINVKPGKEILFAIPGLGLDGQSLVFEVKTKGDGDEDEDMEEVQDDNLHPKKRKGWMRPQYDPAALANFIPQRVPIYADVATQVEPEISDAASQTIPLPDTPSQPLPPVVILKKDAQTQLSLLPPPVTCEIATQAEASDQAEAAPADDAAGESKSALVDQDDDDDFCPPGLSISSPAASAAPPPPSVIEVVDSRATTPMEIESPPGSPPPTDAQPQAPSTLVESEMVSSPTMKSQEVTTPHEKSSAPRAILAIPRTVSRPVVHQTSTKLPAVAPAPVATLDTAPLLIRSTASPTPVRPQSSVWTPVGAVGQPALAPVLSKAVQADPPIAVDALNSATPLLPPTLVKSEHVDADIVIEGLKPSEDASKLPEGNPPEHLAPPPRDPCWLINAPWRHGLLIEVRESCPSPPSKGYLCGEREGKRAVIIFFNFFGSVPSPDTMAKVCFLDDGLVSFIPIKYIVPVPPTTSGQYAVTIQGPAAGVTVKALEAQPSRSWSVVMRFSRIQSAMSTDILCRLQWGSGPPNGFLQDQAPQHPLQPKDFIDRPQPVIDGFEADVEPVTNLPVERPATLPSKPAQHEPNTFSSFTLPTKTSSEVKVESSLLSEAVPQSSKYAPLPDQSSAFVTSTSGPSLSLVHSDSLPREVVTTPGWIGRPDVALPPRPSASQNGPALGKRKRRAGRKKDRRNAPGLPPVTGDTYRPGYDRGPDYDRGSDYHNESYRPEYHVGEIFPPPQFGDSYRPSYADGLGPPRAGHYGPRHEHRFNHDHYAPHEPSRSRSMSRDHGEEDIASSREPSPTSNGRRQGPSPLEAPEASEQSSKPRDDHVHPWPVLDPSHSVSVLADDGTPLELKEVTFSPSGKMLAVCCGDATVRVFDAACRSDPFMLRHEWLVISVAWLDGAAGLMTIGTNGIITKWTPLMSQTPIRWISAKVHDTKSKDPITFAFSNGRVAVVFPKDGVKMWEWSKGIWAELRGIKRSGVTAIKFIHDGTALLGATADGVVWYCEVPNGTMRATTFLKRKILSLNMHPLGTRALVSLDNGHAHIISTPAKGKLGDEEKALQMDKTPSGLPIQFSASAAFVGDGDELLFGTAERCLLLWSRTDAKLLAGLRVEGDGHVDVVANQSNANDGLGCVVAVTRGKLSWWPQPDLSEIMADHPPAKRPKLD